MLTDKEVRELFAKHMPNWDGFGEEPLGEQVLWLWYTYEELEQQLLLSKQPPSHDNMKTYIAKDAEIRARRDQALAK